MKIEAYNQTTQAAYCAAYLSILSTMYGSFIPALSEHHSGGVNVGRTLINGERLGGGATPQERYFKDRSSRTISAWWTCRATATLPTYGVRSFRYAEMVFGNTANVARIRSEVPQANLRDAYEQEPRDGRHHAAHEADGDPEVQRFNPALATVPAGHALPARLRAGVRRRGVVLAPPGTPSAHRLCSTVSCSSKKVSSAVRGIVRVRASGLPRAIPGH